MAMDLDTTKLSQAGSRKMTPHDNCTVLDVGSGSFPRLVELRLPGFDGARQSALWDGSLDLEVGNTVIADEYAGQSIWRISGMGGGDSGAGKQRVSKVWESDFGAVALEADADGNITINGTRTLTIPTDLIHASDPDTKMSLTDDDIEFFAGNLSMLKLTETTQDLVTIGPGSGDVDIDFNGDMFLQGNTGNFSIGMGATAPDARVAILLGAAGAFLSSDTLTDVTAKNNRFTLRHYTNAEQDIAFFGGVSFVAETQIRFGGGYGLNNAATLLRFFTAPDNITVTGTERLRVVANGNIGIGNVVTPLAQLHVDQASTVGTKPVLYLDQADLSEEMIQFNTTIGTGNAIEASALKLLTTTHFIKVTLPGGLTRYTPVGTISTTGPILYKSQTVSTQGLGANPDIYAFGFYEFSATDANLDEGGTTQTFGTANISYAAHAFVVTGGAGSVDAGVVGLRVNGTSIDDQGNRTTSDTEIIIADITAVSLNEYHESSKKWLGQVTYELFTVSGSPTTFSLDFNYGLSKYDDWGNTDFTLTDIEAIGFAGANDANFDIKLIHHQSSGWTYAASGFSPITAAKTIASLVGDHSTDDQLLSSQHMAWKRDDLSTVINGNDSEGFMVFISSSANNAIEYLNLHIGVVF